MATYKITRIPYRTNQADIETTITIDDEHHEKIISMLIPNMSAPILHGKNKTHKLGIASIRCHDVGHAYLFVQGEAE